MFIRRVFVCIFWPAPVRGTCSTIHTARRSRPTRARDRAHDRRPRMPDVGALEEFLAGARVDPAVYILRPDYRALLVAVDGLVPGPSDDAGGALLQEAEAAARKALAGGP